MTASPLADWLAVGDLRSDGLAPEIAARLLETPDLIVDLLDALATGSDVVRGHASDAIERISRQRPDLVRPALAAFLSQVQRDPIPMVRWHLAMLLGNLATEGASLGEIVDTLLALLADPSPFVKSWAISGLCQIGRRYPERQGKIMEELAPLGRDPSIAVRHRAEKAMRLLMDPRLELPASWVKRVSG
jgi:HEAT repeat protein